jgi:hypothetical protein
MKKIVFMLIAALSMSFCNSLFSAEKVYMPFFEIINVNSDYQYSTAKLLKNYVDENLKYILIIPPKPDTLINIPAVSKIQETAKSLDCPYYLIGDFNRIGEKVIISVSMYKTLDGSLFWSDRLKAQNPDDIEPILQKISKTLGTEKKASDESSIYTVTNFESDKLKQKKANNAFGASIGAVVLMNDIFSKDRISAGGGIFWLYDVRNVMYEIDLQAYLTGSKTVGDVSLNSYYPFLADDNTPFIGGGLGFGWSTSSMELKKDTINYYPHTDNYSGSGLTLFIGGGYIIGRTSNASLRIRVLYMIGAFKMDDPNSTMPHGFRFNMELYFGK